MPTMRIDEIAVYQIGYALRGQPERRFPVGSYLGDNSAGVVYGPAGQQNGRSAYLLHCPFRSGPGVAFQELTFCLPNVNHIALRGFFALHSGAVGKSDGVTFRIYAGQNKLMDVNRADAQWQQFDADLSGFAGQDVVLRFETDPGPSDDTSYDWALWADRELMIDGYQPPPVTHIPPPALQVENLWPLQSGGAAPPSGFDGTQTLAWDGATCTLTYEGQDGRLDYTWSLPDDLDDPRLFGDIVLRATAVGETGAPAMVLVAPGAHLTWTRAATPQSVGWEQGYDSATCVRQFDLDGVTATLRATARIVGKSLVVDLTCDAPFVSCVEASGFGPVLRSRQIATPYYSGRVMYLPAEDLFTGAIIDWTESAASRLDDTRAYYDSLTNGCLNAVHERIIYTAAWHFAEALPNIPNPPSPYIHAVGGRTVLDIWGRSFADNEARLENLADYGIRDCTSLIHMWQKYGYDNGLPMHYPADESLGGEAAMGSLISTGRSLGHLMALHENYFDYYPNYDLYNESDIALNSDGTLMKSWFNAWTDIQAFAVKPNAILPLAATQSPEIHARYLTNAAYLDCHSGVPPWFHVDYRAGEPGAGTLRRVWDVQRDLWSYERSVYQGPVFGEGNKHWYWSGCLDGVEAQFGAGWPENSGMTAPLAVDFSLVKMHPLQVDHGMGYYERWWPKNYPRFWTPPMRVLDQYRMQEVAYGHAGFLGSSTWDMIPLAWLEQNLLAPVAERYAGARPVEVDYQVDGAWVDGTAAAKVDDRNRLRVRYENGLTVTANNGATPLDAGGGVLLPQFGWLARGEDITAYTALRDGAIVDYAETRESVFANARNAPYWWGAGGVKNIRAEVQQFEQIAPRTFGATYRWQVGESLPSDLGCFVHFGPALRPTYSEQISFQQDHALSPPTSSWQPGSDVTDGPYQVTIPDGVADGDYEWLIGLYLPSSGERVKLMGVDVDWCRMRLGILHVREAGASVTFDPETDPGPDWLADLNADGPVVDLGCVRTDGSALIRREGHEWVLRTLPRDANFTLALDSHRFRRPNAIDCVNGGSPTVQPTAGGRWWGIPLNGAASYHWPVSMTEWGSVKSGDPVGCGAQVVTRVFPGFFYIEAPDRSLGIRVVKDGCAVVEGDLVNVVGTLSAIDSGESCISADAVTTCGSGQVRPVAMNLRSLGGGASDTQPGIYEGFGLNNLGLLVRVWGKFTRTSDTTFALDDGSGVTVKCVVPSGVNLDPLWTYAGVTGISSCEKVGGEMHRLVRIRSQEDVQSLGGL